MTSLQHRDGVGWWQAPVPPRRHDCWVQTSGVHNGMLVERCACGAIRPDGHGVWVERNTRGGAPSDPAPAGWWRALIAVAKSLMGWRP